MRKFGWTIAAFVVFVGLFAWVMTKERGRVPEKEEVLSRLITNEADVSKIEVVKYEAAPPTTPADNPAAENAEAGPTTGTPEAENAVGAGTAQPGVKTTRMSLERHGDEWWLAEPLKGLVDPETAKTMVKAIVEMKPGVGKNVKLIKEFGLSSPTMEVTVSLKSGKKVAIKLGADTPVGSKIYATISDLPGVYYIPSSFRSDLSKDAASLRDKKLARFEKDKVTGVTFTNEKGTFVLEKQGEEKQKAVWRISQPGSYKGDEWSITSAFGKVADVEAKGFGDQPNNLSLYGLDKPRAQCKLQLKDGKTIEVLVGAQTRQKVKVSDYGDTMEDKDLVYAMRKGRPEVLLVETTLFDDLNKDLMALRDKHVLSIAAADVTSMKVERREGFGFSVLRAGEDWKMQSPQTGPADKMKVEDILGSAIDMEAIEFLAKAPDLRQVGLAAPSTAVTLRLKNGKSVTLKFGDTLQVGPETQYYCQTSDSDQVYKVGDMFLRGLPSKVDELKQGAMGMPMGSENMVIPMPDANAPR